MTGPDCEMSRESLVDYVDGELPAADAATVAAHVARCPTCRQRVQALQRSLAAAREIWAAAEALQVRARIRPRRHVLGFGLAAAAVAAALLLWFVRWPAPGPSVAPAAPADILASIRDAAQAEQLLVTARMLAAAPGGAPYATESFRFIVKTYPHSPAAAEAQRALRGAEKG